MTFPDHPNHVHQAAALLETGKCQLPVDWSNLVAKVAQHESYAYALMRAYEGEPQLLRMITEISAVNLCREQDNEY